MRCYFSVWVVGSVCEYTAVKKEGQDRHPARIKNPISYEKPIMYFQTACQSNFK